MGYQIVNGNASITETVLESEKKNMGRAEKKTWQKFLSL